MFVCIGCSLFFKNICSRYVKFIQPKVRQLLFYLLVQILKWNPAPVMTQTMDRWKVQILSIAINYLEKNK